MKDENQKYIKKKIFPRRLLIIHVSSIGIINEFNSLKKSNLSLSKSYALTYEIDKLHYTIEICFYATPFSLYFFFK